MGSKSAVGGNGVNPLLLVIKYFVGEMRLNMVGETMQPQTTDSCQTVNLKVVSEIPLITHPPSK